MDKEFQQKRRLDRARNKPTHALSGVTTGARQFYQGVSSGITGVIDKPLEGAQESGVGGFFMGVGKGLIGAITMPVVGLIDMTTSMTEGIKSSADDNLNTVTQVRLPRVIPYDGKIKSFDMRESFGQSILVEVIGSSQILKDLYVAHVEIPGDQSIAILTRTRLILASLKSLKMFWQERVENILQFTVYVDNIVVRLNHDEFRVLPIYDQETQMVLFLLMRWIFFTLFSGSLVRQKSCVKTIK